MASSAYPSTPGTTYNNRISRVLLGPCSDQLRDVLRLHVPPGSFPNIIRQYKSNLPPLTATQRNLILPRTGHYSGDYSDMDISLLYLLLRNLCSAFIPEHVNGWGNSPDMMDFTVSANIERIREARNKISHSSCTFLSQAKFNDIWTDIKRAVKSMDIHLMNRNKYEKEIDFLRTETMDPEQAQFYTEQLRKQVEEETRTLHAVIKIQESVSDQEEVLRALDYKIQRTDTEVQSHKREIDKIKHQMQQPYTLPQQKGHFQAEVSHRAETLDDQVEILYSRCKPHAIPEDSQVLRRWILSINESDADKIRILPLKEDETIEVDRIFVQMLIVDDNEKRTSRITPCKMFNIAPGQPARFIFMLGDAGYGKTLLCRRIAKSWCRAWKAKNLQDVNNIQVINVENSQNGQFREWDKNLEDFGFLFYVPIFDINNGHINVDDIIYDYYRRFDTSEHSTHIRAVLKRYKCLIILDGLDEWNISESMKEHLLNKGMPNCDGMPYCTFLITMRSWRFMEVDSKCRQTLLDKVVRLRGLDNNGVEELITNMLCNYYNLERDSQDYREQYQNITEKATSSLELKSLMEIPLLAVFCILAWHEKIETGHSLTTFYLSMIEALMKRSLKKEEMGQKMEENSESFSPFILKPFFYITNSMTEILLLNKLAFNDFTSQNTSFVLSDAQLRKPKVKETVDLFLKIGLVTKRDATGQIHEDNVRIIFMHKTIQEFIYSLCLVYNRSEADIVKCLIDKVPDIEKALDLSAVLTFVSGLLPAVGCKLSRHIVKISSEDKDIRRFRDYFSTETYCKVYHLFNLQISCYREVRKWESISDYLEYESRKEEMKFSFSDIILLGNDTDRLTIRESADILRYHSKDIKSLCMDCIPNDCEEGITNVDLIEFIHGNNSLKGLHIDGNDKGKCRLFNDVDPNMQCLPTFFLYNVAFNDNFLAEFLRKEESMTSIKALGLLYLKSDDDLLAKFEYEFASIHRLRSGYVRKRIQCLTPQPKIKENEKPLLMDILEVLPEYSILSTLQVSYMDSDEDRQMLLQVLPQIKQLKHFGYRGSSICQTIDEVYDFTVIEVLLKMKQLQTIFLNLITLKNKILNFETMFCLEKITLVQFEMNKSEWFTFVASLSNIESLQMVVFYDTDVDDTSCEMLKSSLPSLTIVKDDSSDWNKKEKISNKTTRQGQQQDVHTPI